MPVPILILVLVLGGVLVGVFGGASQSPSCEQQNPARAVLHFGMGTAVYEVRMSGGET
jgi:hypothetical protein